MLAAGLALGVAALSAVAGVSYSVGVASSMQKVRPNGDKYGPFPGENITEKGVFLRLARNEWESLQICVRPQGGRLKNVRVAIDGDLTAGDAVFAASNISVSVVGFVNVTNKPPYKYGFTNKHTDNAAGYYRCTAPHRGGWWPDPILGFLDGVDVADGAAQSFWVRAHCPENHDAGTYRGELVVTAEDAEPRRIPFSVRVNDFTLGRASALPLAITFKPAGGGKDTNTAVKCWSRHREEWVDFLADYFITPDDLYRVDKGGCRIDFEVLKRLKREGCLGLFNLGYWNHPWSTNENHVAMVRGDFDARLKAAYLAAKENGLLDHAYLYGCDEIPTNQFLRVKASVDYLRSAFPGVPVMTTSYDNNYGIDSPLAGVDWFTPLTAFFNRDRAEMSRKAGHKVWWYICCGPAGVAPLANWFVDCQAIEGRMLMGAQTVRMRPDGFLYYQISIWKGNKCIEKGPFTDWNTANDLQYNGDGSWVCAGPDGTPLPTVRLENFRDGLEDYAYAKLLEEKLSEVESSFAKATEDKSPENWIRRAKAALAVPREVMDTLTNYTDDPAVLYRWRNGMADLIEEAK